MKKLLTLSALAVSFAGAAFAQSQRLVLLEHFTQASCGPCATYNPRIKDMVNANEDKMVAIKYQVSWPGVDPMNAQNPSQVQTRVDYYGVNGVPNSVLDGNYYNGHPSGWDENMMKQRYAVPSPFDLLITSNVNKAGDSIFAKVNIKATSAVNAGDLKLHIAVIERRIDFSTPPGSNGEKEFEHVMRQMLPSDKGSSLTPAWLAGEDTTIEVSWKLANIYNMEQLAIVAFVQDDKTKEVHQASYNKTDLPFSMSVSADKTFEMAKPGETATYNMAFATTAEVEDTYVITMNTGTLPTGWSAKFVIDGNEYPDAAEFKASKDAPKSIVLKVTLSADAKDQKGNFTFTINSKEVVPAYKKTLKAVTLSPATTLLYHKDASTASTRLTSSLTKGSHPYVLLSESDFSAIPAEAFTVENMKHIWANTASIISGTLNADEVAKLTAYMNGGGKLLMTGGLLGWDAYSNQVPELQAFYNTYLGAAEFTPPSDPNAELNQAGKSIDPNIEDVVLGPIGSTSYPTGTTFSDWITVNDQSNAVPTMYFDLENSGTEYTCGVRLSDATAGWRTVYGSIQFQALRTTAFRDAFVDRAIRWLDGEVFTGVETKFADNAVAVYPNPANNQTALSFSTALSSDVNVKVFNTVGQMVNSTVVSAGVNKASINTASLPAGLYTVQVEGNGAVATQKLNVAH